MLLDLVMNLLFWSFIINSVFFAVWLLTFIYAHQWMYLMHYRWFRISEETFDAIHYALIGFYKLFIVSFNLVPYLILLILI